MLCSLYGRLLACGWAMASANAEDLLGRPAEYHNDDVQRKMRCLASDRAFQCMRAFRLTCLCDWRLLSMIYPASASSVAAVRRWPSLTKQDTHSQHSDNPSPVPIDSTSLRGRFRQHEFAASRPFCRRDCSRFDNGSSSGTRSRRR
jgi:hypothetical protein